MRALVIAAPSSGAGKTVVTLGLLRALKRQGVAVAAAKCGPDYIDPSFHLAAAGVPSVNLDAWAMPPDALRRRAASQPGDLLIVEGAMGLLDGAPDPDHPNGLGSAADVAEALGAPVVLVLDVARQGQSAAAFVAGVRALRPHLPLAGVILNRVGSDRHHRLLARALGAIDAPILGALPRDGRLETPSRHLGLIPAAERADLETFIDQAAEIVASHVDLEAVRHCARQVPQPTTEATASLAPSAPLAPLGQRIAVASDVAFAFVYPHLLTDWRAAGAELSLFSPLADEAPKAGVDAVFLPGGYPELHAGVLAAADRFRGGVQSAARRGALIYGECGGYMALGEGLVDSDGGRHKMLGLLPLDTSFAERRLTLGYRRLTPLGDTPFGASVAAHEFHYATVTREGPADPLFHARDAENVDLPKMGLRHGAVMGSFAHVIAPIAGRA
ncbi:MAG: cobyrinate a,c-diamide synthase [Pseudomonadota bacterium]